MTIRNRLLLGLALALAAMFEVSPSIGSPASVPEALTAEEGFPYNAFDKLTQDTILADGAELKVAFAADAFKLPKADFLDWVKHSAKAVATYYGKFPVKSVRILILPGARAGRS